MENSDTQQGNTENPEEEPDDGENRFESDFSSDQTEHESAPQTPDIETESQEAVTDQSPGVQEEPSEPPTPQADIKGLADDESMDSLRDEPRANPSSPADEEKVDQSPDLRAEPDVLDDLRRSLTEIEPQEKRLGLMPRLTDWWKRTFSKSRGNRADEASLDARLGDEMLSISQKPAAEQPAAEEDHVDNLFGELEELAATPPTETPLGETPPGATSPLETPLAQTPLAQTPLAQTPLAQTPLAETPLAETPLGATETEQPTPGDHVEVPAQAEQAVTPAPEPAVDASPAQSVEEPHEIERTNYELSEGTQGPETSYQDYQDLRETALEDFEETPAEDASAGHRPLGEVISRTLRELTTTQKRLMAAGCVVILLIGLSLGVVLFSASRPPAAAPTPTVVLGPSYPVEITLPAGWDFPLAIGKLINNRWSPAGAEWLEGTEISRWVSLPWSAQLEAVVKTLKPNDTLVLVMSNTDHLEYKVQSVKQQNVDSFAGVNRTVQSLVVFLANNDSRQTWVITAVPQ